MTHTIVIGAGPAGLTAANELAKLGLPASVLEKDSVVGGISRTVVHNGYRVDIGGHRFFTKVPLIQEIWEEILDEEFLTRPRLSRIYYNNRFFDYPLKPMNALLGLGPIEAVQIGFSYIKAQLAPHSEELTFEEWVTNRFGDRLFEIFFKTYTEKVWGIPCSEISADWAAQRIKNLDLKNAIKNALLGSATGDKEVITTLIDEFQYPRLGPGMMWECCQKRLEAQGVATLLEARVERLLHEGGRVVSATVRRRDGRLEEVEADSFISSMPLRELVQHTLTPTPPKEILRAAESLRYRDFLLVVLIVNRAHVFPDNWIYIHSPAVKVGRVQNFKNWSPDMVPEPSKTTLGLEYFVQENDDLWSAPDEQLVELGGQEITALELIEPDEVEDGFVVRMKKAYPVYDEDYKQSVWLIRGYLEGIENLQTIGRNGQHRYNNQDHSMLTGVFAARNVAGANYDIWQVNVEQEYHEELKEERPEGDRLVPEPAGAPSLEEMVHWAFAQYDPVALGIAVGTVAGLGLFLATVVLLLGPEPRGPTLSLLGNYLVGYRVSWAGAFLGIGEGWIAGYLLGYLMAKAVNLVVRWYETSIRRQLQLARVLDPLASAED